MKKKRIHNFSANFLQHAWNWTLRAYSEIECGKYLPIAIKCSFRFRIIENIREFVFNEVSIKLKDRNIGYSTRYYSGDWNLSICSYGELRRRRGYFMPLVFNIFDITFDISKLIGRTAFPARVTLISISHFVPGDRRSVPRHRYVLVSRFDKYWIAAAAKRLVACVIKRDICTYIRRKDVTYAFSFRTHGKGGNVIFFDNFSLTAVWYIFYIVRKWIICWKEVLGIYQIVCSKSYFDGNAYYFANCLLIIVIFNERAFVPLMSCSGVLSCYVYRRIALLRNSV